MPSKWANEHQDDKVGGATQRLSSSQQQQQQQQSQQSNYASRGGAGVGGNPNILDLVYDMRLEWLHCNKCGRFDHAVMLPGQDPATHLLTDPSTARAFYVTNCGHTICADCLGARPSDFDGNDSIIYECSVCHNEGAVIRLDPETMPTDVERMFSPVAVLLDFALNSFKYQMSQYIHLTQILKAKQAQLRQTLEGVKPTLLETKRYLELEKKENKRLMHENGVIKAELERLRRIGVPVSVPSQRQRPSTGVPSQSKYHTQGSHTNLATPATPSRLTLPRTTSVTSSTSSTSSSPRGHPAGYPNAHHHHHHQNHPPPSPSGRNLNGSNTAKALGMSSGLSNNQSMHANGMSGAAGIGHHNFPNMPRQSNANGGGGYVGEFGGDSHVSSSLGSHTSGDGSSQNQQQRYHHHGGGMDGNINVMESSSRRLVGLQQQQQRPATAMAAQQTVPSTPRRNLQTADVGGGGGGGGGAMSFVPDTPSWRGPRASGNDSTAAPASHRTGRTAATYGTNEQRMSNDMMVIDLSNSPPQQPSSFSGGNRSIRPSTAIGTTDSNIYAQHQNQRIQQQQQQPQDPWQTQQQQFNNSSQQWQRERPSTSMGWGNQQQHEDQRGWDNPGNHGQRGESRPMSAIQPSSSELSYSSNHRVQQPSQFDSRDGRTLLSRSRPSWAASGGHGSSRVGGSQPIQNSAAEILGGVMTGPDSMSFEPSRVQPPPQHSYQSHSHHHSAVPSTPTMSQTRRR